VEIIVFCEDLFEFTVQVIHGRQIIGYGNSTNSGLWPSFFLVLRHSRYPRHSRSKTSVAAAPRCVICGSLLL
jgi:hypothetical protein